MKTAIAALKAADRALVRANSPARHAEAVQRVQTAHRALLAARPV